MITFIALGNDHDEYKYTRHNAGTIVVDHMIDDVLWQENKYAAICAREMGNKG